MNRIVILAGIVFLLAACSTRKSVSTSEITPLVALAESSTSTVGPGEMDAQLDIKKKVLSNGLTIIVIENQRLPVFSYFTFFKVGARYEPQGLTGATHFLEHLMFKGTPTNGPGVFDQFTEGKGGSTNAYTTLDETVYHNELPSIELESIIRLEADRMRNILLEKEGFEKERQVVLEERKMRYENSPRGQLYLATMQAAFRKTPYATPVIGEKSDVSSVTIDQIRQFHDRFYGPSNAVIVVAGGVKASTVFSLISKYYGDYAEMKDLASLKRPMDDAKHYESKARWGETLRLSGNAPNALFSIAFPGEPLGTRKAYVMDILAYILGNGDSSYLTQRFVKGHHPVLSSISVSNYNLQSNGVFMIMGEMLGGVKPGSLEKDIRKELGRRTCEDAVSMRSVQKTKNQFWVSFYSGLETNSGVAGFIGDREVAFGDFNRYKEEMKIYDSISRDEVMKVCQDVLVKNEGIFISVWDKHK